MKQFDTNRFLCVAKWDLAINRHFYLRSALIIFLIMALPAIGSLLMFVTLQPNGDHSFILEPTASVAASVIRSYFVMLPLLFGYMLHNLRSRQGRILELTLPASNAEKFLWHTCLTLFGSLCVAVVSFLLIDLCYNLCLAVRYGFSSSGEFVVALCRRALFIKDMDIIGWESTWIALIPMLVYLFTISTFALGNAVKYRMNICLTIAWNMALCIAVIILLPTAFLLYMKTAYAGMYTGDLSLPDVVNLRLLFSVYCVAMTCLIVLCWAWAYHLYTKATITSRRNR